MKKLTAEQFKDIVDTFENAGYDPGPYSGRGMYGARCLSVTCDNPCKALLGVIEVVLSNIDTSCGDRAYESVQETEDLISILKSAQTDSMGLSQVLYFPDVVWQDEVLDEDESEEE